MRKFFSIVAGVFIAFAILSALEALDAALYPLPDLMVADKTAIAGIVSSMPPLAKAIVVVSWLVAPLGGVWIALRVGDWRAGGWIVTTLFLAANVANQIVLPHPLWMQVLAVLLPLFGGWIAQRLHRAPYAGEPLLG